MPKPKKLRQPEWMDCFLEFMGGMTISSKELDADKPVPLLDVLYSAQYRFLEEIAEGLTRGIKDYKILKIPTIGGVYCISCLRRILGFRAR